MNSKRFTNKLARQLTNARQKKIKRLKTRIASGKYTVSNWDLAKALFLSQ